MGFIGALAALVAVFGPWMVASAMGLSVSASAWQSATESEISVMGVSSPVERQTYCVLAVVGGIVAIIGGVASLLMENRIWLIVLIVGGLLALIGGGWGYSDITSEASTVGMTGASAGAGWGVYLGVLGGLLAIVGGILCLKR